MLAYHCNVHIYSIAFTSKHILPIKILLNYLAKNNYTTSVYHRRIRLLRYAALESLTLLTLLKKNNTIRELFRVGLFYVKLSRF